MAAAITAAGMHYIAHWAWGSAAVFGALIAATDPVSVIATFKEAKVTGRLRLLVEAESPTRFATSALAQGPGKAPNPIAISEFISGSLRGASRQLMGSIG